MRWRRHRDSSFDGTSGPPRSANGASSTHLRWGMPRGRWTACEAVLEVLVPPTRPHLYFWALQVSFAERGSHRGAGHLGLQWFHLHPGQTAVNWGGYGADGRELDGSVSPLPSTPGNPNTRDYPWCAGTPYRLRIERVAAGRWRGSVTDLAAGARVDVRDLWCPGDELRDAMVWSEVFAPCDGEPTAVRWSAFVLESTTGERVSATTGIVSYQSVADGGCVTNDTSIDEETSRQRGGLVVVQRAAAHRTTRHGDTLAWPAPQLGQSPGWRS